MRLATNILILLMVSLVFLAKIELKQDGVFNLNKIE